MKKLSMLLLCVVLGFNSFSQTEKYVQDVATEDAIIKTLYDVISGEPGTTRDWARFRNLFLPESRLIPTRKNDAGELILKALTPEEYITLFQSRVATGFFERELSRKTESFGTVYHLFSTYETKEKKDGPVTNRGINSIQLFKDKNRYYVVNIFWCAESMGFSLPEKYLK
jgi:hypothetical protein